MSLANEVFTIKEIAHSYVVLAENDPRIIANRFGNKFIYRYEMFEPYIDLTSVDDTVHPLFGNMNYS